MKNLEFKHVGPEILEKEIQGLYTSESACQSFWTLKARVELSTFKEPKKENENK